MTSDNEKAEEVGRGVEVMTVLIILAIITATYFLGYLLRWVLASATGYSLAFDLPLAVKVLGGVVVLLGFALAGSTFTVRRPRTILVSTSVTLLKLIRRVPLEKLGARTEPFIPKGPYRWVRNPMYSGVVIVLFGLGVLLTSASTLLWCGAVSCYFVLFLIPREEKELDALFGESYREYKSQVPMLLPTGRRYRVRPAL